MKAGVVSGWTRLSFEDFGNNVEGLKYENMEFGSILHYVLIEYLITTTMIRSTPKMVLETRSAPIVYVPLLWSLSARAPAETQSGGAVSQPCDEKSELRLTRDLEFRV